MSDKAILLDRDDTLIEDPGYINHPDQVKLLSGVPEALVELRNMGYKLVVVSNQSAVARGIVTEKMLSQIHDRLKKLLAEHNTYLDRIYYCPYHPDGIVAKYRKESKNRKPNPGMILTASEELDLDLAQSWVVGNSNRDIEAGRRASCKTILVTRVSDYKQPELGMASPDYRAINLKEAVNIIKKHLRTANQTSDETSGAQGLQTPSTETEPQEPLAVSSLPQKSNSSLRNNQMTLHDQNNPGNRTELLLSSILDQLKSLRRDNMFGEFSIMRMIAGAIQIFVFLCLLISIWFLVNPVAQENAVLIALAFAGVFQLMALTFYIMQRRG